jgi:hypothetical protein
MSFFRSQSSTGHEILPHSCHASTRRVAQLEGVICKARKGREVLKAHQHSAELAGIASAISPVMEHGAYQYTMRYGVPTLTRDVASALRPLVRRPAWVGSHATRSKDHSTCSQLLPSASKRLALASVCQCRRSSPSIGSRPQAHALVCRAASVRKSYLAELPNQICGSQSWLTVDDSAGPNTTPLEAMLTWRHATIAA